MCRAARVLVHVQVLALAGGCRIGFDARVADGPVGGVDAASDAASPCTAPFGAPVPVPGVNTMEDEWGSAMTDDGLELIFYAERAAGLGGTDLWVARRTSATEPFGAAVLLPNVNTSFGEGGPSLTGDGLTLYFSSGRPGGDGDDVWSAVRPDRGSDFATPVHEPALSTLGTDYDPFVSRDGLTVFVSSDGDGTGQGLLDLHVTTRTSIADPFPSLTNVAELNSPANEGGGTMTADGRAIIFYSGIGPGGDTDLYLATRTGTGTWGAPMELPGLGTSGSNELAATLDASGERLLYSSERTGAMGGHDLWMATRQCP